MKKLLLLCSGILFVLFMGMAQSPKISVDPASVSVEVPSGEMTTVKVAVHNIGGRDLNWEPGAYWSKVYFEKMDFTDWTLTENQDHITDNVILTRANTQGLFNIALESFYTEPSPDGTFWANMPTSDADMEDYTIWVDAMDWWPPGQVGKTFSMYSLEDDMFWDITWEKWSEGDGEGNPSGGGFAYTRVRVIPWIYLDYMTEVIEPLFHDSLTIMVDASDFFAGTYEGQVVIESDDPDTPELVIPVSLTVTGQPEILVDNSDIDFDTTYVGATESRMLYISNKGTDEMEVNLATETTFFSVMPESLVIGPNSSEMVEINFTPAAIQEYDDTLHISSANPDTLIKVSLMGEGVEGTEIDVDPIAFEHNITPDTIVTDSFLVKNTGNNVLLFWFKEGPLYFEKADYADWTLPENQDRISENVWITRGDNQSLFNAATEEFYQDGSPEGTEWAQGYIPSHDFGTFYEDYAQATGWCPPCVVGELMTLYVNETDEYHYVMIDSWTSGGSGGGFAYTRSQIPPWLQLSIYQDTLAPGDSVYVICEVDATEAIGGTWPAHLTLQSNATNMPEVDIDFVFNVTGTPEIDIPPLVPFVGPNFIGTTTDASFNISNNTGTDTLRITSMTTDSAVFELGLTQIDIPPFNDADIPISYTPVGAYGTIDTIRITSNDPDDPVVKIVVTGEGSLPPDITVMPEAFDETFAAGTTDTVKLYIENPGDYDLMWNIYGYQNMVEFRKEDWVDWDLPENQDRISDDVWITRANEQGIFNRASEAGYSDASPVGTRWSGQPTMYSDPDTDYESWGNAISWCPPCRLDETLSMNITGTDMYYDIIFTEWTQGEEGEGMGGGFTYTRYEVIPWIWPIDQSGVIAPGEKDSALVVLNGSELIKGDYSGNIMVFSNVPGKESIDVPVTMILLGAPKMTIEGDSIDFDTIMVGDMLTKTIGVLNDSTETLEVTASTTMSDIFMVEDESFSVLSGEGMDVYVTFTPAEVMTYYDTLVISSNDPANSMVKIPLKGTGKVSPAIEIDPMSMADTLYVDSTSTHMLSISNTGDTDLMFEITDWPTWINVSDTQDTLGIDETVDIEVTFDATDMLGDDYTSMLIIESNDPVSMVDTVLLHLYVTGMLVQNPIADMLQQEGFGMVNVDVAEVFMNAQNDSIGVSAISSDTGVVTVSWKEDTVMINEAGAGTSVITLIGRDAHENREFFDFNFRVNATPTVKNVIADTLVQEGFGTHDIDLSTVFADADGNVLTLSAESGNTDVVTVAVSGTTLTVTEVGTGTTSIVVNADDGFGGMNETDFNFTVNAVPTVDNPIADVTVDEGFGTQTIDLTNVFSDVDGDDLTLTAESSNTGVVTVAISGNTLTLTEAGTGTATITVTAEDGNGGEVTDEFSVTVNEVIVPGIDDIRSLTVELYPNPSDGTIYLSFKDKADKQLNLIVFDVTGHKVHTEILESVEGIVEINVTSLKAGLYNLRLYDDKVIVTSQEFVIQ